MTKEVDTCEMNDSIISALNKMREKGYSQLPVVTSDKRIIGTITESNINDMLIKGTSIESLKHLIIKKVMGSVLPQLDKNSPISMIYPLLKYSNAVLIVDGTELKGIITKADVLKAVETYG